MSDDLIGDIKEGVQTDIEALGPNPDSNKVADIVARQAQQGAAGNPVLEDHAAEWARQYHAQGVDPQTAAAAAGARAHQDVVSSRPSIQDQAAALRAKQGEGVPTAATVDEYTGLSKPEMGLSDKELATVNSTLTETSENMTKAGVSRDVAAQAQLAIANAASGGKVLPAGLDIHGKLKVTVYDYVDLTFQSSQIKTTKGATTYTHKEDVDIFAKNVRLTADMILIEPTNLETNWVKGSKESYRDWFSVSMGLSSTTTTTADYVSLYGLTGSFAPLNIHIAPIKVGAAVRMSTRGLARWGIQAMTYENSDHMSRRSNVFFMMASVLLIFF